MSIKMYVFTFVQALVEYSAPFIMDFSMSSGIFLALGSRVRISRCLISTNYANGIQQFTVYTSYHLTGLS